MTSPPVELAGPTTPKQRIVAIDVLRGFALLGILIMNIRGFAMVSAAYMNPLAAGPISGTEQAVWWLGTLLADMKFMALFSMLFGAGMLLMYEHRDAAGKGSAGLHYRRMAGLLVIGLIHAYAIWFGDILVTYTLCGLWLFLLRKLWPWLLITLGVLMLMVGTGLNVFFGLMLPSWPAEDFANMQSFVSPTAAMITDETVAMRGGWWDQMPYRAAMSLEMQTFYFAVWGLWRAGRLMLLGMGLLKLGVLRGTAARRTYLILIGVGFGVGFPLIVSDLLRYPAEQRGEVDALFFGMIGNYWGSVFVAVGYASVIMLIVRGGALAWLSRSLAAVGRMALTNYLAQSVICTLLFYGTLGHGGLFGRVGWVEQLGVVAGVWALQLAWSTWWLGRYRMGPMEALWRWASYGKRPALKL
ncbi:MAG: DUF418 domain-containing protein [Planctomycetota bacterium]